MNNSRISVCIYSDPNFFAVNFLEILLSKNCLITIVSDNVSGWSLLTEHVSGNSRYRICSTKDSKNFNNFNYSIFCGGFLKKETAFKDYSDFYKLKNLHGLKNLIIFPSEVYSIGESAPLNLGENLSIVYLGDLIGPRLNLSSDLTMPQIFNEILLKNQLTVPVGEVFYPLFATDAARTLTRWLFSFGPYGKEIFLLGPHTSTTDFWMQTQKVFGETKLKYSSEPSRRFIPRSAEIKTIPINLPFSLNETFRWFKQGLEKPVYKKVETEKKPAKKLPKLPKFAKPLTQFLVAFLLFPFVLLLASAVLFWFSYKNIARGDPQKALTKIMISKALLSVGEKESAALSFVPFFGMPYKEVAFVSMIGREASDALVYSVPLIKTSQNLFGSVLGEAVYDPLPAANEIKVQLNLLSQEISKIRETTEYSEGKGVRTAKYLAKKVDFNKLKNLAEEGSNIADKLPSLFGKDKRKTYLILFQNNTELRPTGGFIGSFGILTFDGGRMSDLTVNDVYSADGQLKGHVEPPEPIKKYLNEANWWLRDSNWDPDFSTSAQRAEWFLDKEMDQKVDGVFAIDLNLIRDTLKITGPIFLADYNLEIEDANLYEKTQAEAQEEFFPGSHKKASFLTALSRNLVSEVTKMSAGQKLMALLTIYRNFEERHLQGFLHDDSVQNSLSTLGWSGDVNKPSCGDSCYADLIGVTEANVGVNKANYFITRQAKLEVKIDKNQIRRRLTVSLKNNANPALGLAGKYKVYIRSFAPAEAESILVKSLDGGVYENLTPDVVDIHSHKEVGVIAEVLQGQTKQIIFEWSSKLPATNSYGIYVRKQAGVGDDPWQILVSYPGSSLTKARTTTYNTILARDFVSRLSF